MKIETLDIKFAKEISSIKDPTAFLGLARILKVKLFTEEKDEDGHFIPRSFEDIYLDIVDNYGKENRIRRRELLKILRQANKGENNANRTKNSKTSVCDEEVQ